MMAFYGSCNFTILLLCCACSSGRYQAGDAADIDSTVDGSSTSDAALDAPVDADPNALCLSPGPSGWHRLGSAIDPAGDDNPLSETSITIDNLGQPIVAASIEARDRVTVFRYEAGAWNQLGDPRGRSGGETLYVPQLAVRGDDIIATYIEAGGDTANGVFVDLYREGVWTSLGGDLSSESVVASRVGLAVRQDGDVFSVAWAQRTSGQVGRDRVRVVRFEGDTAVPLGELGPVTGTNLSIRTPQLAYVDNTEVAIFAETTGIFVQTRNDLDSDWIPFGTSVYFTNGGGGHTPLVTVDQQDRAVMASAIYVEALGEGVGFVSRWQDGLWSERASALNQRSGAGTHTYLQAVTTDRLDRPVVAWTEGADSGSPPLLYVGRYNGDELELLGSANVSAFDSEASPYSVSLTADDCGSIFMSWSEAPATGAERTVHVFRWTD